MTIRFAAATALFIALVSYVPPAALGQDGEEKSSEAALAVYSDAAALQNNKAFKPAGEEWRRFIKMFPKDPLIPKAHHYLGICLLQQQDFTKAADAFRVVVTKHSKLEIAQDAILNLGWCEYSLAGKASGKSRETLYQQSSKTFSLMRKRYPKGKYLDQAIYFEAESLFNLKKRKAAIESYKELVENHSKSTLRSDGLYALGVAQEELGDYANAGKTYDRFMAEYPQSELLTDAKMGKAETLLHAKKYQEAATMFAAVATNKKFDEADRALSRQAYCLARMKKYLEAGDLYADLFEEFPKSKLRGEAIVGAGRNYYRAKKHTEAKNWLDRAIDAGGDDIFEAGHWMCRIHLEAAEPKKALELATDLLKRAPAPEVGPAASKAVGTDASVARRASRAVATRPKAAAFRFVEHLRMDQADAQYAIPTLREKSVASYAALATDFPRSPLAPQALYNAAFAAMELKKSKAGLQYTDSFLVKFSKDELVPDVRYVAAECHLQEKAYDRAAEIYTALVGKYPDHSEVEVWKLRSGLTLFLQKKHKETIAKLSPLVETLAKKESQAEAYYLVGASQYQLADFPAATAAFRSSLSVSSAWRQADETMIYLSRSQHREGKTKDALGTVRKVFTTYPKSRLLDHAHYRAAEYQYAVGQYEGALADYKAVLDKYDKSLFTPFCLYGQGWCFLKLQKAADADTAFTRLLDGFKSHRLASATRLARGMARRQAKNYDGAINDLQSFLAGNPKNPDLSNGRYELGLAQASLKKYADAVKNFTAIVKDNAPFASMPAVLYELAWAYRHLDDAKEATATFQTLADRYPKNRLAADANFRLGEAFYDTAKYQQAISRYDKARLSQLGGDLGENIIHKLGWSYFQAKRYPEAFAQFEQQIRTHAEGKLVNDARFMRAECLLKQEKYEQAQAAFQSITSIKFSSPQMTVLARLHGGQAAAQEKNWEDVIKFVGTLPADYPKSPYLAEAHFELGRAQQSLRKYDAAETHFETATTKNRGLVGAKARFMLGELKFLQKKHAEALGHFQRVMFGYGGTRAAADVKIWQARSGFEAGRCEEVLLGGEKNKARRRELIENAKSHYEFVVKNHANSKLAQQAKLRLAVLSKL